jgi:hypothetical protein
MERGQRKESNEGEQRESDGNQEEVRRDVRGGGEKEVSVTFQHKGQDLQ